MLPRFRHAAEVLPVLCLSLLLNAGAQTPAAPPMIVQAPFVSLAAGNLTGAGLSQSTKAAACTGYADAGGNNYGDGCPANQAGVSTPWGVTADKWGNVYFSDEGHIYVRVIYAGATTVNGVANPATAMITAANATLSITTPLVAGDVYALAGGLTAAGVTTCNGGATALSTNGSGCPATDSYLKGPYGPAVDSAGNVFIVDKSNSLVYVVIADAGSKAAQLVTLENPTVTSPKAGYIYAIVNGGGGYVDGVLALSGKVHGPFGIAVDANESVYIADGTNNLVRMINGPGITNSSGTSNICAANSCAPGYIHAIAGLYATCTSTSCTALAAAPSTNVAPLGTGFDAPMGIAVDGSGNVFIGDNSAGTATVPATVRVIYAGGANNPVAKLICIENSAAGYCGVTPSLTAGDVYTIAGSGNAGSSGKGAGLLATNAGVAFDRVNGLALDSHGNVYVMDYGSHSELAEINADTGYLVFLSADGEPTSTAKYTVGNYCSNNLATGSGPTALDQYGDGCPAPQSNSSNAQGNIGIDPSGNLYYADNGDSLIRKLTFNGSFPATTAGNSAPTQSLAFLLLTGSSGLTVSSVSPVSVTAQGISAGSEYTDAGAGDTCSSSTTLAGITGTSTNTANDVCVVPIVFKPANAGIRAGAVQISGTINGNSQLLSTVFLNGIGNGAELAIDPGASSALGSGNGPQGVATDSAGNVYVAYSNGAVYRTPSGGGSPVQIGGGLTTPHQVALDGAGDLYVADSGTNEIVEFPGASTSSSVITGTALVTGLTGPRGVALDASGNLYIAETGAVLMQSIGNGVQTTLGSGFTTPVAVALDASGNVYVADTGLQQIEKLTVADGVVTQQSAETLLATTTPVSVAVDAAGDVYYGDSTNGEVVQIPVGGTTAAIASGFTTPVGVALDPRGNLYVADSSSTTGIGYFSRTAATLPGISKGTSGDATITNIGNTSASSGISSNSDLTAATDFTFAAGSSNGCNSPSSFPLAAGNNCDLSVTANTATATDTVSFSGSASTLALSSLPSVLVVTTTTLNVPITSIAYGGVIAGTATVAPKTGSVNPTGTVTLLSGTTTLGTCTLSNSTGATSACNFTLNSVPAGSPMLTASYGGDGNNAASTSSGTPLSIAKAPTTTTLNVPVPGITLGSSFAGTAAVSPAGATGTVSMYLDGSSTAAAACTLASGTCSWTLSGVAVGSHALTAAYAGDANNSSSATTGSTSLSVSPPPQAPAVATGDSRVVVEPSFPAVCADLNAALVSVNNDIPASVDATVTNPDGVRIQAALNSCSANNPGQAVELSVDGAGNNAFITGPLSMPSNVTLLVDPGVIVYFSRNAQDYDKVAGTHTCGTVNSSSATGSCRALIDIPGSSTNVGIMGFGKLDGRGGDPLINAIAPYQGQSWWGLSAIANSGGSQQNPRFVQIDTGASNITMYKITLRNAPLFHVSTTGATSNFTAWDIKIVTPTSSRNTDGIDPGNATNFTITRSWISDGDDNVAVGGAGATAPAANISVTDNHFFAGHGESIGSYTSAGISNILFDGNMSSGNGTANLGSASITGTADSNSTGLRIKSGFDRGGLITNIQYSNSCYQYHKAEIVFSPNYEATTGTESPNLNNILMQNLAFLTAGTAQFTGTSNSGTVYPLQVTLDNVSFPSSFPASEFSPAPTNASLTFGPGDVSSNFVTDYGTFVGANSNTVANNITVSSLFPPTCNFTYIAPELTGPMGMPQTITFGQNATAVVILTPAVGGAAYPTGTVTLTDALTSNTTTVSLTGTTDTISIPLQGLSVGTHSFTATYSGDSNYPLTGGQTVYFTTSPYSVTVNAGSLSGTTTGLSGVPSSNAFGTTFTATATVTGSSPTGTVEFLIGGGGAAGSYVYATAAVNAGSASATFNLPYSLTAYTITAVYSGDAVNAGSASSVSPLTITQGNTATALSANTTTTALGHPASITANVTSVAGNPAGTVSFTYSTTLNGTQIPLGSATLVAGAASISANLPVGTDYVTATYTANGSFAGSVSTPMTITVNQPTIVGLPNNPIALPYTMTTIAGGSGLAIPSSGSMACTGATDKYGDGCQGTAISLTAGDDLRAVVADPFGNVYFSDISAALVRRITPNGVVSNFAGLVSGTACVPTATSGCKPTLVSVGKARGLGSDAAGNIYIANYTGNQIFEIKISTGLLYLVAGTGTGGSLGDGNAATSAQINQPRGAWGDTAGNIYIADTANNKIRVVDAFGNIHTFAGTGTAASNGDGTPATSAAISNPQGVIADANLNVYIADSSGGKIRVVCVTCGTNSPLDALLAKLGIASPVNGDIYTVAGNGATSAFSYTAPVLSTGVSMAPQKMAFDATGDLYISDSNGFIWFLDFHTGYLRAVAANAATPCAAKTDNYGDGCPATQASFGSNGGNGMGVGADALGNAYISDGTNSLIRKVITGLQSPSTAVAATATLPVQIHFTAGDGPAASNALAYSSTEWSLGTPSCATNADNTRDCLLASGFTPAVPGARSTPLTVNSSAGNTAYLALTGTGLGAGSTLDPATQISFGAGLQVAGLATDTAGNVYVSDSNSKQLLRFAPSALTQGASAASTTLATLTAPGPVVVDPRGFVYVGDTSTGLITQISPSGTVSTLPFTFTKPAGVAVDALNNLYVSDSSAQTVYQIDPITGAIHTLSAGTLVAPAGLAVDPSDNLLITDPGAGAIYRFSLQSGVTSTISSTAVKPSAIVTDAAGDLLIADTADILVVPASSNSSPFTVAGFAPSALAIDSAGDLYTGSGGSVVQLMRTQGYVQFAGGATSPVAVNMLDSGNQALLLSSIGQTDTTDYSLAGTATKDCTLTSTLPSALAVGGVCTLAARYTPTTFLTTVDTATLNGNLTNATLSTPSAVQLTLTGPAAPPASTIALTFSPASPVYGQSVTATATVSGPSITPAGTVQFTVDGVNTTANLSGGVATLTLPGLGAGDHTASAVYSSTNGFAGATATTATLTVAKATATVVLSNLAQAYTGLPLSATATPTPAGLAVSLTYNGSSTPPTLAGSYAVVATVNDPNYAGTASGTLVIGKTASAASVTSSANPVLLQNAITLTAKVTSTAGTPTGTVTFLDGTTVIGTGTLSAGVATLTISSLAVGTHSITASYGGDPNFSATVSGTLTQVVEDFNFTISAPSVVVLPGGTATFTFTVAPIDGSTFPAAITLTVGGLPAGATFAFSPATLAAGAGATTVTLTVNIPQTQASARPYTLYPGAQLAGNSHGGKGGGGLAGRMAPFALAILLLPFARRMRRTGKRLGRTMSVLLLLAAGAASMAWIGGCGSNSGYFAQAQKTYTVTVTGTAGALSHSATVTLTVE